MTGQGGKQIILQKQGTQPQIVTLVKTSQGMQVATVPKVQGAKTVTAGPQIIQTSATGSKTAIPQGATIVKLVNAPGTGKIFSKVKLSLVISTTFLISRQKVDQNYLKMARFLSIPNLK